MDKKRIATWLKLGIGMSIPIIVLGIQMGLVGAEREIPVTLAAVRPNLAPHHAATARPPMMPPYSLAANDLAFADIYVDGGNNLHLEVCGAADGGEPSFRLCAYRVDKAWCYNITSKPEYCKDYWVVSDILTDTVYCGEIHSADAAGQHRWAAYQTGTSGPPYYGTLLSLSSCPLAATPTPTAEITIDDGDVGFSVTGTWTVTTSGWSRGCVGYNGSDRDDARWTLSRDPAYADDDAWAKWTPNISTAGWYEVFVRFPGVENAVGDTYRAHYQIHHRDGDATIKVTQKGNWCRWIALGRYYFDAGTDGYLYLGNYTENESSPRCVMADAAKWVRAPANLVETIYLPADGTIQSSMPLQSQAVYDFVVEGIFRYDTGADKFADAQYRQNDNQEWEISYNAVEFDGLRRAADASNVDNHAHTYRLMGNGNPVSLRIYDNIYDDNTGSLLARVFLISTPPPTNTPTATATATPTITPTSTNTPTNTPSSTPTTPPTETATPRPTVEGGDAYEHDDLCDDSQPIATDGTVQFHTFHAPGDEDWVHFEARADTTYLINALIPCASRAAVALTGHTSCEWGTLAEPASDFSPAVHRVYRPPADGRYYLQLANEDPDVAGTDVSYYLSVRALPASISPGALVLVAGQLYDGDHLQEKIHHVTNAVYRLFRDQGYDAEDICYLASDLNLDATGDEIPDVDALATRANVANAITSWAVARIGRDRAFTLYLMDHGGNDAFYLDGAANELLTAEDLDHWLQVLETAQPEAAVNVIMDACYAGSFITAPHKVSAPGRVVIASTGAQTRAYASEEGALFSDAFVADWGLGLSLWGSFMEAQCAVQVARPLQAPWLDDDGDGMPNEPHDGLVAARRGFIPPETYGLSWPPYVAQAGIGEIAAGDGVITAEVRDDGHVLSVWAEVFTPSYVPLTPTTPYELVQDDQENLPTVMLLDGNGDGIYGATFMGFEEVGDYRIVVYAIDDEGLVGRPKEMRVRVGGQIYLPVILKQ